MDSKKKSRWCSLRMKTTLRVTAFLLVVVTVLGAVLLWRTRSTVKDMLNERMVDIVKTVADMIDGDVLGTITGEDVETEEYQDLYGILSCFEKNIGLKDVYAVRKGDDGGYIMVIDPSRDDPAEYGWRLHETKELLMAGMGAPAVNAEPYSDEFGRFYSAYSPVFYTKGKNTGKVAGVIVADFEADWYESQLNRNAPTIFVVCLAVVLGGIGITVVFARQYGRTMDGIRKNLRGLKEELEGLVGDEDTEEGQEQVRFDSSDHMEGIQETGDRISVIRGELSRYISHARTQANNMITAMASDYRSVYHVDLDRDDGVCYRADSTDFDQTPEGVHFPFHARFVYYAETYVAENYRNEFLSFIDPDNIRNSLKDKSIIAYRYLVRKEEKEYYEMIRMAGVRRAEDRDDGIVHAIGLGLTVIDEEMRGAMAKNEALAEALAMAEEANMAKTAFLSNMSHEIRTPMNAIIGLNTLALHDSELSPQTREFLEKIGSSARHLLGLINDILDMSRIESGKLTLRQEEFSFSAMLEQINTMVMSQCSDKGLTYECRLLSGIDDCYIGDDMKLKEVLINILSNAIKFTDAPGSITLSVERTAVFDNRSTLRFVIKDTGIGMDKEFIPKIFDSFSQEDSSRKNKYGSTGLGMAISKRIVDMMNGTISVESEKGVGSEFTVVITLRNSERTGADMENSIDLRSLRVLVVDDEEIAAEHARMVLDEVGIRADVCLDGESALQMLEVQHLKQEPYNLVLMDWKMPGMDGLDAAKKIRERYSSETTVIILTAYNWDDILEEALKAGVDSFLAKPLFATNVINEFDRIARRNNMKLFKEKQRADITGCRVLLAEDIEINAEIMMDILSMRDVEADHAENGKEAVELFEKSAPGTYDAILMDIRMPIMDGLEATETIRAMDRPDVKKIPIIALTANAFDEDVQRSLQAGMNAHLTKPVESEHLYQTLEELIYEARQ